MKQGTNPRRSALRRPSMGPTFACAAALAGFSTAACAQTYDVQVNSQLNGLDIRIEPVANGGVLVVNLTNHSGTKVRCDLKYEADPQVPSRAYVFIDPGRTESSALRATQKWFSVTVSVECRPTED